MPLLTRVLGIGLRCSRATRRGKSRTPPLPNSKIVIPAAERLAPTLDHPEPPAFAAVAGRQLIEMDDAMGNAVDGAVGGFGGQIVEHHDRRLMPGEIVLERKDLPPVAQRALGQKADLRQAVDHDSERPYPLNLVEDAPDCLAKLEIGGIEQALVLVGVEHAFRRNQLEYSDALGDGPIVRGRSVPQFLFGFREAHINATLPALSTGKKKLKSDSGLSAARTAFEQMQPVPCKATAQHVIETGHACRGPRQPAGHIIHVGHPVLSGASREIIRRDPQNADPIGKFPDLSRA
jgi:hypothetical protein